MGKMKRAMMEIRDRGWPVNDESLKSLIKEKERDKMNHFICEECKTKYQSKQEESPPGIHWDDGHTCKPVPV